MSDVRTGQIQRIVCVMTLLLIPLFMYGRYYCQGVIPGDADMINFFSSQKIFGQDLLKGEFVQWNKYLAGGMPQSGVGYLYFVGLLLSFLPLKEYIYIYLLFHIFVGSFFFYKYLRECKCNYSQALVMAVIFECSIQINGLRKSHPTIIAGICLLPIIMYLVKKFFNTKQGKWLYASAFMVAIQATIALQYAAYLVIVLFVYLMAWAIYEKFSIKEIILKCAKWVLIFIGTFAYSLLPSLSILSEYQSYGSSSSSYETFSSYSLHPIKVLQMIVPEFFGNPYQAYGIYYSSEMDIEMYVGIFVLLLVVFLCYKHLNKFDVKIDLLCALVAFVYGCVAHIPVLNQLVYRIPYLGDFRCSGRFLYILYFFMFSMAAKALHYMRQDKDTDVCLKTIGKMAIYVFSGMLILVIAILGSSIISVDAAQQVTVLNNVQNIYAKSLLVLGIIALICYCLIKIVSDRNKKLTCFYVLLMLVTLWETLPYSLVTNPTPFDEVMVTDPIVSQLQSDIDNYKIWDAFDNVDGAHESIISQNKSIILELPSINSYTIYNNPCLCKYMKNLGEGITDVPFNYSGMLTGTKNAENLLFYNNELLSMLGVKYIIDSSKLIELGMESNDSLRVNYEYYGTDEDGTNIYLNKNANDVLFFVNGIQQINDKELLYSQTEQYMLSDFVYMEEAESCNFDTQDSTISILTYGNNSLCAKVKCTNEGYMCFSQNYSKNWKAYVDGEEVEVELVNGLIMGISIPAGEHSIEFKYFDSIYILGFVMSGMSCIIVLCTFLRRRKKNGV